MENSLFQFNGDVTIGTAIAEAGIVDASIGKTINQQPIVSGEKSEELKEKQSIIATEKSTDVSQPRIRLKKSKSKKDGRTHDLFRIIGAMYQADFFVDEKGRKPFQKDVYKAFGEMLGEDFTDYDKGLSKIRHGKNRKQLIDDLFSELADAAVVFTQE